MKGVSKMIFCVEDDDSIRELVIYTLNSAGFEARGFVDAAGFFDALRERKPRLVMLDIMLPGDDDGIAVLKKLRQRADTADIPVIMATAKGTEYDKVIGLDLGADDYLVKPFGMMEMVSRIKALLRRTGRDKTPKLLCIRDLELNPDTYTVSVKGENVQLTLKEYELLCTFMENPKHVFTRDRLLEIVWGMDYAGETRTVDVHIGTLRTKLGECGGYIETVRGVGYRMID